MSKRKEAPAAESRSAGKRRVSDGDLPVADTTDELEDLFQLEGEGELEDLEDGCVDDDLAGALEDGEGADELEATLERGIDRQESEISEIQESEAEDLDGVDLPFDEAALTGSEELDFSDASLSASQLRRAAQLLATNTSLTVIHFEGHDLAVADLKEEDELEWDSEEFTDAEAIIIAELLRSNTVVKRLDLARNQVTDAGAKALAQMLCENSTLEYLNLESNLIGGKGGAALARSIPENKSLQYLNLMYNSIAGNGSQDLRDVWQRERQGQLGLHL